VTGLAERRVRELVARAIAAGRFPGAIAQWGPVGAEFSSCGEGRAELWAPPSAVTTDTWFDLASLTKPLVTTTLSLVAFREGALTPNTRVGEVLSATVKSPVGDIEIHRLLTHTSGLPAWLPFYCLAEGRRTNLPQALQRIKLEARPGERVVYSCVGFIILGLMLEEVSGSDLDGLFYNRVLVPTGLENDLGFNPDPTFRVLAGGASRPLAEQRLVRDLGLDPGWIPAVGTGRPDDGNARFFGGAAGNAGLFGTARGVRRLTAEYCGSCTNLLSADEIERAVTSQTGGLEQERGWGWQIAATPGCSAGASIPATAFGHTGFTGVSVWADRTGAGIWVLLTNRNHPGQRGVDLHPVRRRFHSLTAEWCRHADIANGPSTSAESSAG